VSENIYEGFGLWLTVFACGKCREVGPCFQLTAGGGRDGDFVVIHRDGSREVADAILKHLSTSATKRRAK